MTDDLTSSRRLLLAGSAAAWLAPALGRAQAPAPGGAATGSAVIDVNRARTEPIPIAIPALVGSGGDAARLGQDIGTVITNNLGRSGLFRPIDRAAFISAGGGDVPNFQNWKVIGAQALVTGRVESQGGDKVRVEFRLWDVLPGQQIQGTAYTTTLGNWRRIAHIISDVIYERLLGEKGYFDTRIVYIAGTGPRDRRIKRLAIMDQDGENNRFLTDGGFLALTPRFHPTRDEIAFMSYLNNKPRVYLFDLGTGRQQLLGNFDGITLSPRFSPDGSSIIMAQTTSAGGSVIMQVGLNGAGARRLTDGSGIDVSPCFSPGRVADRVQLRPRRRPATVRDERRWQQRAAHQLRPGPLRHPGLVAARRSDRLYAVRRQHLLDRRDAAGRVGRAHSFGELLLRRPDLRAERACDHVLAGDAGTGLARQRVFGPVALHRYHRLQRARRHHPHRCLRSGLVAAGGVVTGSHRKLQKK